MCGIAASYYKIGTKIEKPKLRKGNLELVKVM